MFSTLVEGESVGDTCVMCCSAAMSKGGMPVQEP